MTSGKALRCKTVRQLRPEEQFYFVDESIIECPQFDSALYYVNHVEDWGAYTGLHALVFDPHIEMGESQTVYQATLILKSGTPVVMCQKDLEIHEAFITVGLLSGCCALEELEGLRSFMSPDLIEDMYDILIDETWEDLGVYGQVQTALFWDNSDFDIDDLPIYEIEEFFSLRSEILDE